MIFNRSDYAGFLCIAAYAVCSVIIPVALVNIAETLNFPLNDGGMGLGGALQLGRSIPMVAAMIFCGFAAGRWGKSRCLGWSLLLVGGGILTAAFSPIYGVLFLALAVAGLGEGTIEGLLTPYVQDLHPEDPGRYINFTHSFWSVGVVLATAGAGTLLCFGVSWRLVLAVVGVFAALPALLFLLPAPAGAQSRRLEQPARPTPGRVVWLRTRRILKLPRFWMFFAAMFLAGGGEFCLTFWCASLIQLEFGGSALTAGFGTAVFACGMMIGRMYFGWKIKQQHLPHLVLITAAAGTAISLFFPGLQSLLWLFMLLFPIGIASAPFWPSIQSHSTVRLADAHIDNTMLFVLLSCAGVPGCGFFAFFMGWLGDRIGLRSSFYLVPLCYLLMGAIIAAEGLLRQKKISAPSAEQRPG